MARLLLGVSGGIAAYKAIEAVRLAGRAGHSVRVIQTRRSLRFVGRASFAATTGAPVLVDEFEADPALGRYPGEPPGERAPISHLALVERADAFLIAPASANTLAKLAHGHADNLLTTAALAAPCPVAVAPAMNHRMWEHPATRHNVEVLRGRGVRVIEPEVGELASHGEYGAGRMAEPDALLAVWEELARAHALPDPRWAGRRVLITAGGTREPIDSVRFLGNRSSGRMGVALAEAARDRGAQVTLVAANLTVAEPQGVDVRRVQTAAELLAASRDAFPECDVLLMSAAVADFRPAAPAEGKIKKERGVPELELERTEDVLMALGASRRAGQTVVGFAAEHGEDAVRNARRKLEAKNLDAVVVNDISRGGIGFDTEENEVVIVTRVHEVTVPRRSKREVAEAILDAVAGLGEGRTDQLLTGRAER